MPECWNDGCTDDARERSSYCSNDCREEDTGYTIEEMLDPNGEVV